LLFPHLNVRCNNSVIWIPILSGCHSIELAMTRSENSEGPSAVLCELANAVAAALNWSYLIERDRHDPAAVLKYVTTLDQTLKRTTTLIIQTQKLGISSVTRQ